MKNMLRRFMILTFFFIAALVLYFFVNTEGKRQKEEISYSVMDEASLPVIYADMCGRRMNPMTGYRSSRGNLNARDQLTVLPQDRALKIEIIGGSQKLKAIRYEIRSLDMERLVENTEVESWEIEEQTILAVLPIQNLLTRGREYLLSIQLDTEAYGTIYYYTRIVWREQEDRIAESMIDLAEEFSRKTFTYDEARDLVTYLETDPSEDNGSFDRTNIRSSFSQLTWGRLKMQPAGDIRVTLRELDGIMGCVVLNYPAVSVLEGGRQEFYEVEEAFTMKWSSLRIYMMDYERTVNQIVTGDKADFSGKRIMLGIMNPDEIDVKHSPDGQILVYRAGKDIWSWHQKDNQYVRIFSFRNGDINAVQSNNRNHGEIILKVSDDGDVEFLVYGYQNRGYHEGETGIAGYRYHADKNGLEEVFFVPVKSSYDLIRQDLEKLSYCTQNDVLYIYLDHAIYSIDMNSNESMLIVDGLEEGSFVTSEDQSRLAWMEGGKALESHLLHLLNLESGEKMDIQGASEDEYIRALGFVGSDLVYGMCKADADWIRNGRRIDKPMYVLEIRSGQMEIETRYEKKESSIAAVEVNSSRVRLQRVKQVKKNEYVPVQEDTIVCNEETASGEWDSIGYYASPDKGRVYFVQLNDEIRDHRLQMRVPDTVQSENSAMIELHSEYENSGMEFYAYGAGRFLCRTKTFTDALNTAYGYMGLVTDKNGKILWNRVNRDVTSGIRDLNPLFSALEQHLGDFSYSRRYQDGSVFLDAKGCTMMQLLYFIGQGHPLVAYTGEGEYVILKGYDQYNVSLYDPVSGENYKMGLKDGTEFFQNQDNDFVCVMLPEM